LVNKLNVKHEDELNKKIPKRQKTNSKDLDELFQSFDEMKI
jgi:hypothetical protein